MPPLRSSTTASYSIVQTGEFSGAMGTLVIMRSPIPPLGGTYVGVLTELHARVIFLGDDLEPFVNNYAAHRGYIVEVLDDVLVIVLVLYGVVRSLLRRA